MKRALPYISIFLLSLQSMTTQAQDTTALESPNDTVWQFESLLGDALAIPSYEELLRIYFEAVVTVDSRLHNNPYRLMPGNYAVLNPFVYKEVILPKDSLPNLLDYKSGFPKPGPFSKDAYAIQQECLKRIAYEKPELITATWDQLPDAPKTEKADIIYNVDLDLERIDKKRQVKGPKKIEKQDYLYEPWAVQVWSIMNINQTAFSNWAKGGSNSFSISGQLTADMDYTSKDKKTRWANDAEVRLGYLQQEDKPFVKNLDLFRLNTQFARNAFNKWYYAMNAEFSSQFFEGYNIKKDNYDDPISDFLAPAYLKLDIGLDYKYGTKSNKKLFSMQASPLSYKLSYVRDTAKINQTKYGIDEDKRNRQEIGGSVLLVSEYSYLSKFSSKAKLQFFSNYIEEPENIDVNLSTTLTYRFSRIFSVTFTLDMIYDDDVSILLKEAEDGTKTYGQRLQVKEFLGFGLTYRLM